jgi:hypothetical protein
MIHQNAVTSAARCSLSVKTNQQIQLHINKDAEAHRHAEAMDFHLFQPDREWVNSTTRE